MGAEHDNLVQIAGLLSDGTPVDWPSVQRAARDDEERQTLHFLERVASIVRAHDRLHESLDAGAGVTIAVTAAPSAADSAVASGPKRWGRLELRGALGAGSFAEVQRAWDPDLGREVALKLLHAGGGDSADAALHEGRLLARVRHPNVVTVYGAESHDGRVGVWMELVRGRTLDALRHEQGTFGAREAALIGLDLCRALTAVHQAGLVHRDINTRNVMRADGGRIVLMDFGTGRETALAGATMAGTPYFMAPEVLRGEPATARSDLYALGVVLFHLVTGTYPVRRDTLDGLRDAHAKGEATLLREARADLEPSFVRVVEKALAADPAARWASAGQMEQALSAALGVESSSAAAAGTPAGMAPIPAATMRRRPQWLLAAAAIVVAVGGLVGGLYWVTTRADRNAAPAEVAAEDIAVSRQLPATPPAMQIEAAFYRRHEGGRERIDNGSRVEPGDGIALELRANAPLHVYVVNEDEHGDTHLLFPLPGFEPANPLAGDRTWILPGSRAGNAFDWEVSSAGGRERLLVIASRERLTDLEADLLSLPRADEDAGPQYAQLSERAVQRLRGIGALQVRPQAEAQAPDAGRRSQLDDIAARLSAGVETAPGIWVQRVEFENPR